MRLTRFDKIFLWVVGMIALASIIGNAYFFHDHTARIEALEDAPTRHRVVVSPIYSPEFTQSDDSLAVCSVFVKWGNQTVDTIIWEAK